jgi:hypothetical protein
MTEVSEAEILEACQAGAVLECGDGNGRRPVDAALLRRYCDDLSGQVHRHGGPPRQARTLPCLRTTVPSCSTNSSPVPCAAVFPGIFLALPAWITNRDHQFGRAAARIAATSATNETPVPNRGFGVQAHGAQRRLIPRSLRASFI